MRNHVENINCTQTFFLVLSKQDFSAPLCLFISDMLFLPGAYSRFHSVMFCQNNSSSLFSFHIFNCAQKLVLGKNRNIFELCRTEKHNIFNLNFKKNSAQLHSKFTSKLMAASVNRFIFIHVYCKN